MPTPVSTARQCLTEEAARVLDDAVSVAKRRCHAQTTSLHAISALLALPSSLLREACLRARSNRFQFRALDLCVSVSLDRLQSAKNSGSEDDPPPVSNSLMAAIKRSQANQRRQPEMYQITQISSPICSITSIKVELKNFVVSILDDPIVSRVLGDAGFRSTEIKLAILHPPTPMHSARFGRCPPPMFLCSFPDSGIPFPFNLPSPSAGIGDPDSDRDETFPKMISEVLVKSGRRNPLLFGAGAKFALASFKEAVEKGNGEGFPSQIVGLEFASVESEVMEFVSNGGSKEVFDSKIEALSSVVEKHSGPGVLVNFGELKVLMEEEEDSVKFLIQKLTALFELHKKKMWLIGRTKDYETYSKFLDRFPSLETNWDLHPLALTALRFPVREKSSKSSLMGSFVPFGGFFSNPPEFRNPLRLIKKTSTLCSLCNEKYDQELSAIKDEGSSVSVADKHSSSLPSWLQSANSDVNRTPLPEITAEKTKSSAEILELQKKWDEICQGLHQSPKILRHDTPVVNPVIPGSVGLHSNDPSTLNLYSSIPAIVQKPSAQEQIIDAHVVFSAHSSCSLSLAPDHVSSSCVSSMTTELQLGTFSPKSQELKKPISYSSRVGDYKRIVQKLTQKISWQSEACYDIAQIISRHQHCTSDVRRDSWIFFSGSDRTGKKKMAEAFAELMFGSRENLISIDLSTEFISDRETAAEYIVKELKKNPCLIVFLENVDKTNDLQLQASLSRSIQSGKFVDSRGRETSIKNAIFLMTYQFPSHLDSDFTEEGILQACSWQMQIVIDHVEALTASKSNNPSIVTLASTNQRKKPKLGFLDLNLPVQDDFPQSAWLRDFLGKVETKIEFKPFDFDGLAEKLVNKMNQSLLRKSGSANVRLEVDRDVMLQILAATWCSDQETAVENWINNVLRESYIEAQRRFCLNKEAVLRIVICPGRRIEQQQPGICLPRIINL